VWRGLNPQAPMVTPLVRGQDLIDELGKKGIRIGIRHFMDDLGH